MKKTLKLMAMMLCVFSIASLSSCTKDNNDSTNNGGNTSDEFSLVGKWKVTYNKETLPYYSDGDISYHIEEGALVGSIWEFTNEYVSDFDGEKEYKFLINNNEVGTYATELFGGRWLFWIFGKISPNDVHGESQYWTWEKDLSYDELKLMDRNGTYTNNEVMVKLKKI